MDLSRKIAAEVGTPRFYLEREREVALSRELFAAEPLVAAGIRLAEERGDCLGHGLIHIRKVAIDVGALILIEEGGGLPGARVRRLVLLAHLSGLLHDIRRTEKDHAERGADEAARLLTSFPIQDDECAGIAGAIRNHEAFRPFRTEAGPTERLLSDALYDADKFRWGPDNFTEMLWDMVEYRKASLDALLTRFLKGMEGIKRIRETFRTHTGKIYGPDFIDRGIEIGMKFYTDILQSKS